MGLYIEGPTLGKANYIASHSKSKLLIEDPLEFSFKDDLDPSYLPVCIISNGYFEAALVCVDQAEFNRTLDPDDHRPRIYLLTPIEDIKKFIPDERHEELKPRSIRR